MSIDASKLTPAPWVAGDSRYEKEDLEFIAIARNAFDVMMRRGWYAARGRDEEGTFWFVRTPTGFLPKESRDWGEDPFTALIEADRWYRENVEAGG